MLQGDALGAGVIGDIRLSETNHLWTGPWRVGLRPEQALRMRGEARVERPEADRGSKIR